MLNRYRSWDGAEVSFEVADNDEPPIVVVPDPVVIVRSGTSTSLSDLSEGDTVQLEAELTNAPEGGATEDITVFLAARAGGTAKPEDIDFPASVYDRPRAIVALASR